MGVIDNGGSKVNSSGGWFGRRHIARRRTNGSGVSLRPRSLSGAGVNPMLLIADAGAETREAGCSRSRSVSARGEPNQGELSERQQWAYEFYGVLMQAGSGHA